MTHWGKGHNVKFETQNPHFEFPLQTVLGEIIPNWKLFFSIWKWPGKTLSNRGRIPASWEGTDLLSILLPPPFPLLPSFTFSAPFTSLSPSSLSLLSLASLSPSSLSASSLSLSPPSPSFPSPPPFSLSTFSLPPSSLSFPSLHHTGTSLKNPVTWNSEQKWWLHKEGNKHKWYLWVIGLKLLCSLVTRYNYKYPGFRGATVQLSLSFPE